MVSWNTRRIGLILRFAGAWPAGSIRRGGWAVATSHERRGSGGETEMGDKRKGRRGQPSPALIFRGYSPLAYALTGEQLAAVRGGMRCAFPPYARLTIVGFYLLPADTR